MSTNDNLIQEMKTAWNSPVVFRRQAKEASGGAISRKYLANLDSQNAGPPGKRLLNGKICYPASSFFSWLEERIK